MAADLTASRYADIPTRGQYASLHVVRRELNRVINAPPTQLHPDERTAYLTAILNDLEPGGGRWTSWPADVHHLALQAVKVLGRNPVGSKDVLLQPDSLTTLLFHTGLSLRQDQSTGVAGATGSGSGSGSGSGPGPTPRRSSKPALEALRALANVLVLHPRSRPQLAAMGVGQAVAAALGDEVTPGHLFLLGRVGFLITADGSAVKEMVDEDRLVPHLVKVGEGGLTDNKHIQSLPLVPANYDTLSEVLKLTGNVLRTYPENGWDSKLNPLLTPLLGCLYGLELNSLVPPLTHTLHGLLSIPFPPELLPTWATVPVPEEKEGSVSPVLSRSVSPISRPTSPRFQALFRKKSNDASGLVVPSQPGSARSSFSDDSGGLVRPVATTTDPTALPRRLVQVLTTFTDSHLKGTQDPSPDLQLDDHLPPVLLLATHAAAASPEMRAWFRKALFPGSLDRQAGSEPLEKRPGLLGALLRVLNCTSHPQSRDTAGELFWSVCGANGGESVAQLTTAHDLCDEIGYGNAAGLLFRKGMSGPPEARVTEMEGEEEGEAEVEVEKEGEKEEEQDTSPPQDTSQPPSAPQRIKSWFSRRDKGEVKSEPKRNPITSLDAEDDDSSPFAGMTEEEKEAEAEKMFVLFDRLSRNPVISAAAPGEGGTKSVEEAMREQVSKGVGAKWEEEEGKRELARIEKEEEEDEEGALKELAAYRERKKKA